MNKTPVPFVWPHYDNEDELFYVVKGNFDMEFRDKILNISEGEFILYPGVLSIAPMRRGDACCFI